MVRTNSCLDGTVYKGMFSTKSIQSFFMARFGTIFRIKWLMGLLAVFAVAGFACGGDGGGGTFIPPSTQASSPTTSFVGEMQLLDYGMIPIPAFGTSQALTLTLPEGASAFTIIADGTEAKAIDVDISSVVGPQGQVFITESGLDTDPIGRNGAQNFGETTVALNFPSAIYDVPAGEYTFTIGNFFRDTVVHVFGVINPRTDPTGGVIDINVVIVALNDYTGVNDPNLATMVNELRRIYALQNVTIGAVNQFFLDRPDLTDVSINDVDGNGQFDGFDDLIPLTKDFGNSGMNFFLVSSVGEGILGLAGGIPGPPLIQGTAHSGVVISTFGGLTQLSEAGKILQGGTMAHEGGHYLGLFHPTERSGRRFDPLPDTPECGPENDTNEDGNVVVLECLDLGGTNLMFWTAPPAGSDILQDRLTNDQKFVLHRNPLIHE